MQNGRGNVEQIQVVQPPFPQARFPQQEDTVLAVVGVVRPGVVLEGVNPPQPQAAHRAPAQVPEKHDQVRRHAAHRVINLFGLVHLRPQRLPLVVEHGFQLPRQLFAHRLDFPGRHHPLRLPAAHVQEDAAVVPAFAPGLRLRPINLDLGQRRHLRHRLRQAQVALLLQPLVHTDAAFHLLRAVVGDHEHAGLLAQQRPQLRHLAVDEAVIVQHGVLEPVALLVLAMAGVAEFPEGVVEAVGAHLDHHEEVPRARAQQVARHGEVLLGHPVNLLQDALFFFRAEVFHVQPVGPELLGEFRLEAGRVGELGLGAGGQKATHQAAVHRPRRVGPRHRQQDHLLARSPQDVPDAVFPHGGRVGNRQPVVAMVLAIAEAVDAQLAGVLAAHHAGPGRHGDGRDDALQARRPALLLQTLQAGELVPPAVEHQLRRHAIQPHDRHLGLFTHAAPFSLSFRAKRGICLSAATNY